VKNLNFNKKVDPLLFHPLLKTIDGKKTAEDIKN